MKSNTINKLITSLAILLLISCGGDDESIPLTAAQHTAKGWVHFQDGQYEDAIEDFNSGLSVQADYTDALNGLSWTLMMQDVLVDAKTNLDLTVTNASPDADTHAGLGFVLNAMGEFAASNASFAAVKGLDANWEFSYISNLGIVQINLTCAQNFVNLSDFSNALTLFQLVDNTFSADVATPTGQQLLLEAIEALNPGITAQ